jgi:hypothetical protein
MIPNRRRLNLSRNLQRQAINFLNDLELHENIVMLWVPTPINILHTPLGEQAIDFALCVKRP